MATKVNSAQAGEAADYVETPLQTNVMDSRVRSDVSSSRSTSPEVEVAHILPAPQVVISESPTATPCSCGCVSGCGCDGGARDAGQRATRPQRADARANREKIMAAAVQCLRGHPGASISEIAKTAGVGRMTLIGHFRTRADLVEACTLDRVAKLERIQETEVIPYLLEAWKPLGDVHILLKAAAVELPEEQCERLRQRANAPLQERLREAKQRGILPESLTETWLAIVLQVMSVEAKDLACCGGECECQAPSQLEATLEQLLSNHDAPRS
ncbi:TetR/AcrR family transcriptional regulator [Corynebacterium kozikiae]|uniref:TetR/AcrR family transcriptional regulator n=1 Tax=Corynebacterium kozikiae TaxID=2968469 RepID=UPI00211BFCE6|nr:TetR/AcrR family transcriptional regulator [Corynebacterium sp. 76QC2CO]MCQ9344216.1 TetR/AcrR family transcriptional regulator [Corynebacterium sp. 76QC2CO]